MAARTRMVIVLKDGEELRGTIEWYDRTRSRCTAPDAPNMLLMKDSVKYMYKEDEDRGREDERSGRVSGRPRLALTLGDPAGIGPEIVLKALALRELPDGGLGGLRPARRDSRSARGASACRRRGARGRGRGRRGGPGARSARSRPRAGARPPRRSQAAVADALAGPRGAGSSPRRSTRSRCGPPAIRWPGHTELLAEAAGVSDVAMLFVGGGLRVALLTIHRSLRSVPDAVTRAETARIVRLVHRELPRLGAKARRIAVCGVNPHAGEHGLFGREDEDVLRPAVEALRAEGLVGHGAAAGRHASSCGAAQGEFDAVVAAYHDQGLVPVKLAGLRARRERDAGPAVRPHVRRPRHGLRHRRAGTADPGSLLDAMALAVELASVSSAAG